MTPDQRAFRADLEKGAFLLGVAEQKWRHERIAWPQAIISVGARDGRWFALRFDLANYPVALPTARLWNLAHDAPLALECWPRSAGGRVSAVFNPGWKSGTAIYLPCDREAMPGHDAWATTLPSLLWRPALGIVHYLEIVHELLTCNDYTSPAVALA